MVVEGLTQAQLAQYQADGFTVLKGFLSPAACDELVEHMLALHRGDRTMDKFEPRAPDDWNRVFNPHFHDPKLLDLLLHPELRRPLAECFGAAAGGPREAIRFAEADGIQTMYFYKGSEQRRHQDAYYLPECMSAWMACQDVDQSNGTIWVQKGSHRGKLLDAQALGWTHGQDFRIGAAYNDAVDALFEQNAAELGLEEAPVEVAKGDVVLFHGTLIHRGGPIGRPGSFRHVLANHYIPHDSTTWPYPDWPRYSFDGERRCTTLDPPDSRPHRVV